MSYIRAKKVDQNEPVAVKHGFALDEVDFTVEPTVDMLLEGEQLAFALELIAQVDSLAEGEALVVWKEIF